MDNNLNNGQGPGNERPSWQPDDAERGSSRFISYDISSNDDAPEPDVPTPEPKDIGDENFDVRFDFDKEYRDVPENRPLRQRRERKTGCLGGILYFTFVVCISLLIASLGWLAATDVLGFGSISEEVNVTIPSGFDIDTVSEILYQDGLIKYKFLFKLYANYSKAEDKIVAGSYTLNKNYDYRALVQGMTARGGVRVEVPVTIPEGFTMQQIFNLLETNEVCSAAELWDTAANYDFKYGFLDSSTLGDKTRLEGYLFPDSYRFYVGSTPVQAISKLLDTFKREMEKVFTKEYMAVAEDLGYSLHELITVASLIEREAGTNEDRDLISSVIFNRLGNPNYPYLQIDAAIYYAIAGTGMPFSLDVISPYNTHKNEGLPPGPIANPGIASIRAAFYPQSTDYYFYALKKTGDHHFSKTLGEHEAFVKSDEYGG